MENSIPSPLLIVFGGLPGTGKTAVARELARQINAVYLRIDSIEQELHNTGLLDLPLNDAGYRIANAIAADNLRLGHTVVADCVNPVSVSRDAWIQVASNTGVRSVEIEMQCSDKNEHRRRVETRSSDIEGLRLPTWDEVVAREYHSWSRDHLVIDTFSRTVEESVRMIREMLLGSGVHL